MKNERKRQTEIHYGENTFHTVTKAINVICISNEVTVFPEQKA